MAKKTSGEKSSSQANYKSEKVDMPNANNYTTSSTGSSQTNYTFNEGNNPGSKKNNSVEAGEEKFAEELTEKVEEEIDKEFQKESKHKNEKQEKDKSDNSNSNNSNNNNSNDSSSGVDTSSNEWEEKAKQNKEDQEARKEQYNEAKAELEAKKEEAIEKVKDWRDKKIEHVKSGPHGIVKFFTGKTSLAISAFIDSSIAALPVVGDFIGFAFNLVYWFIPFMLGGAFLKYIKVVIFYVIDLIIGLIAGTIGNIIPVAGDMIIDAIPEVVVMFFMKKYSPPNILLDAYQDSIPKKIHAIDNKARDKIAKIQKATSLKEKGLRKILKGKRPNLGVSMDGQKMITFLFALVILFMGPVAAFLPFTFLPQMSLSSGSIFLIGLIVVLLFLFTAFKFISQKNAFGLGLFMGLNLLMTFLLSNTAFLAKYLGNNTVIAMILLFIGSGLYIASLEGWMSSKNIGVVVIILLLLLSIPYGISYIGSARFDADVEKSQVEAQGKIKQGNFVTQLKEWFAEQKARGSGEIINNGENEQTSEFIGVKIEDVSTYKDYYHLQEPIIVDISYSANSYQDLTIMTLCEIQDKGISGEVNPKITYASETKSPRVRCEFNDLEKGYYNVDVTAYYNYISSTKIPIVFMEEEYANRLLYESRTANGPTPEEKVGAEDDVVLTDSGPIYISASNAVKDGVSILKNPLIVDREEPNLYINSLKIQFPNFNDAATNSGIDMIKKASFSLPPGLQLYDCSFARGETLSHTENFETGRWMVEVFDEFTAYGSYETIDCQLQIDPNYIEEFIPSSPGVEPWERHTIGFEVDYNYKIYRPGALPFQVT